MTVVFPPGRGAHTSRALTSSLHHSSLGLVVAVPRSAGSGKIYVMIGGRRSKSYGPISIVTYKLHPPPPPPPPPVVRPPSAPAPASPTTVPAGSPFAGQGMWIWYVNQSDGGNLASIVAQAKAAGVTTLYIKSSDGSANFWPQFSPALVQTLHANGLKACAWQYVYGTYPTAEADLGARAAADGADCLVIDAESEYEGRYASAQAYIDELRAKVGPSYPVGLASFPYVYYHESEPYSVFLGPGAPSTTSRRCTGRTSAPRSTPCTRTPGSPTASTRGRSSRSVRPTRAPRRAIWCASARRRSTTARAAGRSGTSRRRAAPAGPRSRRRWRRSPR